MARKKRLPQRSRGANLLTSVVLVLPLLVFYEVGVLFTARMNGADLITQWLLSVAGQDGFLLVQLGLVLAMLALALYLKQKQQFDVRLFVPVLLESAIYALTMGTLIIFVMVDLLGIEPSLMANAAGNVLSQASVFERLVMAVGAGVHEELVFRLFLMGGLLLLFERTLELRPWIAVTIAVVATSLLFSAAHHIGPFGEALRLAPFVYRSLAGVFFALLFRYRSFAIAVYTHALYDIYVMLLAP